MIFICEVSEHVRAESLNGLTVNPDVHCTCGESYDIVSDYGYVLTLAHSGESCYGVCLGCGFSPNFDRSDSLL
jgi:hypothetical protein